VLNLYLIFNSNFNAQMKLYMDTSKNYFVDVVV